MAKAAKAGKPNPAGKGSPQETQEELAFLRQKCNSLSIRGHYVECVKTIEENLDFFYSAERWPENFLSVLRLHQKCYPSTGKEQPHEEYVAALLKKHDIPYIFAALLRMRDNAISWTAEFFRDQAAARLAEGDKDAALAYSDLVIKIEPGSPGAYVLKGNILEEMGLEKESLAAIQQALELNPGNRHALSSLAKHYGKTDPAKALELVEKAIERYPDDSENYSLKAFVLLQTKDTEGALAALDKAMSLDPYNPAYPYERAEILYSGDKKVAAIPQYRIAVALDAHHVPSLMRLAELSFDVQPDLALGYVTTVATADPQNKTALLRRGKLLQKVGQLEAAVRQYRDLLDLDSGCHQALGGLGSIYLQQEQPDRALVELEKAVALAPGEVSYRLEKGRTHKMLQEREKAVEEYRAILSLEQKNAQALGELGFLFSEMNPKEALDYFNKALALDPENAFFLSAKAEMLLQAPGKEGSALDILHQACKYDPGNGELHAKLGKLLEAQGNLASAIDHYKKALSLLPDEADICFRLAHLLLDTFPDQSYLYINNAIRMSVTRGEYYFLKARIIIALGDDPASFEKLRPLVAESGDEEALGELGSMSESFLRSALVYIDRAIEMDSENPVFLCLRAHLFYRMGQKPKAQAQYEKLLKNNPEQHEALFGAARILAGKKGAEDKALAYFDKAISIAPAVPEYHAEKAALLARDDNSYESALRSFDDAIAINNQMWQVILEKARLLDRHGELESTLQEYRRVLLLRPENVEALSRTGVLLCGIAPATALVYFDHAIRFDPENFLHRAWRGRTLLVLGREDQALDAIRDAQRLGGDSGPAIFQLAEIFQDLLPDEAMAWCRRAVQLDSGNAAYHLLEGDLELAGGNLTEARASYEKASALDSKNHDIQEKLARVACLLRSEDCRELIETALGKKADCPACLYIKARILEEMEGDPDGALEAIQAAVKRAPREILYQEKLVELLSCKRSLLNLAKLGLEKHRLEKLRRQQGKPIEIPEPPLFGEESVEGESEPPPLSEAEAMAQALQAAEPEVALPPQEEGEDTAADEIKNENKI